MPFAPHEIENKRFVVALRGYSTAEVDAFLRAVAADYQKALDAAQPGGDDVIAAAERDAAQIREDARLEAEAALAEIDRRAAELASLEAEVRNRLTQLESVIADGVRALT